MQEFIKIKETVIRISEISVISPRLSHDTLCEYVLEVEFVNLEKEKLMFALPNNKQERDTELLNIHKMLLNV